MYRQFRNDYSELAHPRIMNALAKYASETNTAYGLDYHSENAKKYIKETFGAPNADVFFLAGGTQTNMLTISYFLNHYEAVICADTGHINVHETGAVEGQGYKIITIKNINGKISAQQVEETYARFVDEHMVKPRMVYVSNSSETGSIYHFDELKALYEVCQKLNMYFFIDGARLGSALTSKENDVKPADLGKLCDIFYVSGTKNGFLFGEALVINNASLAKSFRFHIKNKGAMLAKGYAVGIEFEEAFKDGFYFELAKQTNENADYLKEQLRVLHLEMLDSPTNQIFITFDKQVAQAYLDAFAPEIWTDKGDKLVLRFVLNFSTTKADIDILIDFIKHHK